MSSIETARVAFAGTPEFAVPCLESLIARGIGITCVLTQPDRPAGRGRKPMQSAVKRVAAQHGIPVVQPAVIDEELRNELPHEAPDLLIVVAYGLILPRWMLEWPRVAPVNVHASLLPRWRGAAPIQHAILAGDERTGISIMQMTRGLDCGPVYARESIAIGATDTAGELHDRLAIEGARLLADIVADIVSGALSPAPQDESDACVAPKIEKADAVLDWNAPADALVRRVRAFNPWPVAEARTAGGARLRIWQAEALDRATTAEPGTVVVAEGGVIDVAAANGLIRLQRVQSPGGRVISAQSYLTAHSLKDTFFVGPD